MKSVLVYGDSQTWGRVPGKPERMPFAQRWTSIMSKALGPDVHVIVEALNGRTTCRDEPWKPWRNGAAHLDMMLACHAPLDLVIIALGCNDLQWHQHLGAYESMLGAQLLIEKVQGWRGEPAGPPPKAFLLAPPRITEPAGLLKDKFREAPAKTDEQQRLYAELAAQLGAGFFSMAEAAEPSPIDGIHLDVAGQAALAAAITPHVANILGMTV